MMNSCIFTMGWSDKAFPEMFLVEEAASSLKISMRHRDSAVVRSSRTGGVHVRTSRSGHRICARANLYDTAGRLCVAAPSREAAFIGPPRICLRMQVTLLNQILFWSLLLHQAFVVLLLLSRREARYDHSRAIAVCFGANMLSSVPQIPQILGTGDPFPGSENLGLPFVMLLGPSIFLYCRALVSPSEKPFSRADLSHCLPFAVALLLAAEIVILQSGTSGPEPISLSVASGRQLALTALILMLLALFVGTTTVYLVRTLRLLARHRRSQFDHFSSIEGRSLSWMEGMMVVLVVSWGLYLVLLADELSFKAFAGTSNLSVIVESGWVYALSFMVLWQQVIYQPSAKPVIADEDVAAGAGKYNRSALDDDRRARIAAKIELAMTRDRLYRNQSLTLRHLSDHTRVTENYLSQVLNETLGRNFYEYVNHWRIKEAQALLVEGKLPIIEIGEEVGFNSRSTFNAAFRKESGMAPSEYRSQSVSAADAVLTK
jgi:AraC-like DNA-binding protein